MKNRSVPVDTILPHVVYQDVAAAIEWLTRTFGFQEHYRYGDPAQGAQMHLGDAWVMLTSAREGRKSPSQEGVWTQSLTVFVVEELNETMYGERQYAIGSSRGMRAT